MAYKILGQTSATAAAAPIYGNLIKDPSFEGASAMMSFSSNNSWTQITGTQWYARTESSSYYAQDRIGSVVHYTGNDSVSAAGSGKYGSNSIGFACLTNPGTYDSYMGIAYGVGTSTSSQLSGSTAKFGGPTRAIPVLPSTLYYFGCDFAGSSYSSWYMRVIEFNSSGSYNTDYNFSISGGSSWGRNTTSFTTLASTAYVGIEIYGNIYKNNQMQVKIDGVYFGRDSSYGTSFKDPNNPTNLLLNSGFTSRFQNTWAGTVNNSETITNYAGAPVLLYTVPASKEAVISTVTATNASPAATTYRIAVVPAAESLSAKHWVTFDSPLNAYGTDAVTIGMTLATGDKLYVSGDVTSTQFTAFGSEA